MALRLLDLLERTLKGLGMGGETWGGVVYCPKYE